MSGRAPRVGGALGVVLALLGASTEAKAAPPRIGVLEDGERALGDDDALPTAVVLDAFRGETATFQIVVDDDRAAEGGITIELPYLEGVRERIRTDAYVEHFVDVTAHTRNVRDPGSSLGWTEAARPREDFAIGPTPDALIPIATAFCPTGSARTFCPYPIRAAHGAVWFDVHVPETASPGLYGGRGIVKRGELSLGTVDVSLHVAPARLPEAVSVFAYYAFDTLQGAFDDAPAVEASVAAMLRAHHVDAFTAITSEADVERVGAQLSGELFSTPRSKGATGDGRAPAVIPIGAYGSLGDPTDGAVRTATGIARFLEVGPLHLVPPGDRDVFVYAIDETCSSPRGGAWRKALGGKVLVGQTCDDDPASQDVDVVMMSAEGFRSTEAQRARAEGKKVFVYNGRLPFAGPMMLDAPLTSLTANGWIAASYDVGRWFYWETTFWNDGNRGGLGPRDPFADPETFHNGDGDACLADGLLLYPGRQRAFHAHSLDVDAVMPSMRLKALRRGIEDAGLLALAASVDRGRTLEIDERIVRGALDEADPNAPPAFTLDPKRLAEARKELRAIVGAEKQSLTDADARDVLDDLRAARAKRRSVLPRKAQTPFLLGAPLVLLGIGVGVVLLGARLRAARAR